MNWIDINDELPELHKEVLIAYADNDGKNPGICKASLQGDDTWCFDWCALKGEDYAAEYSKISHWFDYQEYLKYPNK